MKEYRDHYFLKAKRENYPARSVYKLKELDAKFKLFRQGMRVTICGRIQTGSYTNRDGQKVYTTDVVVEEQEFAESKAASEANRSAGGYQSAPAPSPAAAVGDGFMNIPDGIDEELPFN